MCWNPLTMEDGPFYKLFGLTWNGMMPLVWIILALVVLFLLLTFLFVVLIIVFLKLRDIIRSNTSRKTTELETKLIMLQVGMAQMNQELQLIQNVLETLIPIVSQLKMQQAPRRFLPTPVTTQQAPRKCVRTQAKGCLYCGENSHYLKACPYKAQTSQEKHLKQAGVAILGT